MPGAGRWHLNFQVPGPNVQSPPEPAKTASFMALGACGRSQRSNYFKINTLKLCEEFVILLCKLWEQFTPSKNVGIFGLEPASLLRACKPGSRAHMDCITGHCQVTCKVGNRDIPENALFCLPKMTPFQQYSVVFEPFGRHTTS